MSPKNKFIASKLQPMLAAWHENKGNWLLATAVVVCILASVVGYFDLIPEIRTEGRTNFSPVLGGKTLEVRISGCKSDQGRVVAMLFDGHNFSDESIPIRIQNLEIQEGQAIWPIYNLAYGLYAISAFQDIDRNDLFDPTVEPHGLSRSGKLNSVTEGADSFENAAFDFSANQNSITVTMH